MNYPSLRLRDRGSHAGLQEIVFSEDHSYDEAQTFATNFLANQGMTLVRRCEGPDAWLWDVRLGSKAFVFGYDDYPCETVLFPENREHQEALLRLFAGISGAKASTKG